MKEKTDEEEAWWEGWRHEVGKTVVCNGQRHMEAFRGQKKNTIIEAISVQGDHGWISAFSLVRHENAILGELNF